MSSTAKTALATLFILFPLTIAYAQPLVTGNLTLYYDFDEIVTNADGVKQFLDESGNNLPGTIFEGDPELEDEPGTMELETDDPWRGAGAALFTQNPDGAPVYVDVDGRNITENFPDLLPTSGLNDKFGLSIAAWLNVTANTGSDQSVFQGRTSDGGHGAPHFQLQGDGKFRMTFRDQTSTTIVDAPRVFTDGTDTGDPYPINEWFHYAGTYDAEEDAWAMYYNGVEIQSGQSTGVGTGDLGDWGGLDDDFFGAGFGAVYDNGGRRLDGAMDELYVFNRALTADEVAMLVKEPDPVTCNPNTQGDLDGNGKVEFADFLILSGHFGEPPPPLPADAHTVGDIDCNGKVEFADFLVLSANFGNDVGGAESVPEPSTFALLGLAGVFLGRFRRRR